MKMRDSRGTISLVIASLLSIDGCGHVGANRDIVLESFSQKNYTHLNKNIGRYKCIVGKLYIDSMGVYFALQPIESDDIIDIGFSRIISGLSYEFAKQSNMNDGEVYKVCGILRDVTPFRTCNTNYCKWYELENAKLG